MSRCGAEWQDHSIFHAQFILSPVPRADCFPASEPVADQFAAVIVQRRVISAQAGRAVGSDESDAEGFLPRMMTVRLAHKAELVDGATKAASNLPRVMVQ